MNLAVGQAAAAAGQAGRPLLVASVIEDSLPAVAGVLAGDCDLAEVRLDALHGPAPDEGSLRALAAASPVPLMATCRPVRQGGRSLRPDAQRLELLAAAARAGFAWVDVELESASAWRRVANERLVVSHHVLDHTPDVAGLAALLDRLRATPGDVLKLVTAAGGVADGLRVLDLYAVADRPLAAFCMGEAGFYTRVLGAVLSPGARAGSRAAFVYGAARGDAPAAPGQVSVRTLARTYGLGLAGLGLGADHGPASVRRVYGVVGDPVAHSRSPALMNALFRAGRAGEGLAPEALYLPFLVPDAGEGFSALRSLDLGGLRVAGLSVTIPHKEAVLAHLDHADADVEAAGAANTVVVGPDGAWRGLNTDLAAVRGILRAACGDLGSRRALVLGAGGAAAAAALALAQSGAEVVVCGRTPARASTLAGRLGITALPWDRRAEAAAASGVVVHCTPVGMDPDRDASPLPDGCLRPDAVVLDAVYTPPDTRLLAQARASGARAVSGLAWFVGQAALQLEAWTGRAVDRDVVSDTLSSIMSAEPSGGRAAPSRSEVP